MIARRTILWLGGALAAPIVALWLVADESPAGERAAGPRTTTTRAEAAAEHTSAEGPTPEAGPGGSPAEVAPEPPDPADLEIFRQKIAFARAERLDTLPLGSIIARLGVSFVGTTYTPNTLDVPGPERLVVNLRELDCVTFVESTLALARLVRAGNHDFEAFRRELTRIRYRGGIIDGYPSRLHYFSDWIADNQAKGVVRDITRELGGIPDPEPIGFMSRHREAYPRLADTVPGAAAHLEAIRATEEALGRRPRHYIPEDRIAEVASRIRDGDIIAATSTLEGLDVAHTGIALWVDGELHLLHAPLVGKAVEISAEPLAERIRRIPGQDGIMVARPH